MRRIQGDEEEDERHWEDEVERNDEIENEDNLLIDVSLEIWRILCTEFSE